MGKYDTKQVIVVRKDLNMRKGKIASQVAHASMKVLLDRMSVTEEEKIINKNNLTIIENPIIHRTFSCEWNSYYNLWLEGSFAKVVVSCDSKEELLDLSLQADERELPNALITDSGATEFNGVHTDTCLAIGPHSSEEIDKITGHLKLL